MSDHTPIPWAVCPDEQKWIITIVDDIRDDIICEHTSEAPIDMDNWSANAAFIVLACNNHDRLKRENAAMREALEEIEKSDWTFDRSRQKIFGIGSTIASSALASLKEN